MEEPNTLRAGDSIAWRIALPDYPASAGWVLKYRLIFPAGIAQDITTTPDGDDHTVDLSAAATADYTPGTATLVRIVENGAQRITLASQTVTILPNLALAATHDNRTLNERALADAEAALAAYMASGKMHVEGYGIADKNMKFRTAEEIETLINYYRRAVTKERTFQALLTGNSIPNRVYYRG